MPFKDRRDAGVQLAERLRELDLEQPLVLALPRGGVPIGFEIAAELRAPLDVIVVRKLGAPGQPELAAGAVGEGGVTVLNWEVINQLGVAPHEIERTLDIELAEVERRVAALRRARTPEPVKGRTVVLVDDGLATGATATAAARILRERGARTIVLAVPVASPASARALSREVDVVVALETPERLRAIGTWYDDFSQTPEEEVVKLLEEAARSQTPPNPSSGHIRLVEETPVRWRIEQHGDMRVPGIVFASRALLPDVAADESLTQAANVATLPGIVGASYVMPDVHWGYGFPIGGVAATDVEDGGVVSPGGVGFDISCGVRLLVSSMDAGEIAPAMPALMDALDASIPRGLGRGGIWNLRSDEELAQILLGGSRYAVERGFGEPGDLERCEDGGAVAGADPDAVSARARERGLRQVGSLGSGNHFLEVQQVEEIYDARAAEVFGLAAGRVCVMIHCGSRGLGHQICSDHVRVMIGSMRRHGIVVPDKQLACAPVRSPEGAAYLGAMAAAANYGRANRQLLSEAARDAFAQATGSRALRLLYDVSHNLAKLEMHDTGRGPRLLCVHRKGATRALPPGHPELPGEFAVVGQPVLIPGSMGTSSYVLAGVEGGDAFHSTCHGAGRTMSRHAAKRRIQGSALRDELEAAGIRVRASSVGELAEEAPAAYKDVDEVVAVCERAGLCARVARLRPLGVVKG